MQTDVAQILDTLDKRIDQSLATKKKTNPLATERLRVITRCLLVESFQKSMDNLEYSLNENIEIAVDMLLNLSDGSGKGFEKTHHLEEQKKLFQKNLNTITRRLEYMRADFLYRIIFMIHKYGFEKTAEFVLKYTTFGQFKF